MLGRRFNRWTVIGAATRSPARARRWIVRCECGSVGTVIERDLASNRSRSCRACSSRGRFKHDLTGKTLGRWLVLERRATGKQATWYCRCACGNERDVAQANLVKGGSRSCGCSWLADRSDPEPPPIAGARWIALGRGKFALVDDTDYQTVTQYRWHYDKNNYAQRTVRIEGKIRVTRMHVLLLQPQAGFETDHVNGDGLDNRRMNLRIVSRQENIRTCAARRGSASGYRGVRFSARDGWMARISDGASCVSRCGFASAEEAARAYDALARKLHGQHARMNFPTNGEQPARRGG